MNPRLIVAGILLAVAALTFVGLAYETVPKSTTQTIIQMPVQTWVSYSPYLGNETSAYTSTEPPQVLTTYPCAGCVPWICDMNGNCYPEYPIGQAGRVTLVYVLTLNSTYQVQEITAITSSRTVTTSTTTSSTSLIPASQALGLTNETFSVLAVVVIGVLSLMTILTALKSKQVQ